MNAINNLTRILICTFLIGVLNAQKIDFFALRNDGTDPMGEQATATITVFKNGIEVLVSKEVMVTVGNLGFFEVDISSELDNVDISGTDELSYMVKVVLEGDTIESNVIPWRHGLQTQVARRAGIADSANESEVAKVANYLSGTLENTREERPFLLVGERTDELLDYSFIDLPSTNGDYVLTMEDALLSFANASVPPLDFDVFTGCFHLDGDGDSCTTFPGSLDVVGSVT